MKYSFITASLLALILSACGDKLAPVADDAVQPTIITEQAVHDTDDPAIWINPQDPNKSLIIGTDKENGGGLYAYNFEGKIVNKYLDMQRPNNVDIAYDFIYQGEKTAIAVVTERNTNKLRIFKLPELTPIDHGGIPVFEGESKEDYKAPMGIALYTQEKDSLKEFYAIVGRKDGPETGYLWQYLLTNQNDTITGKVVRKFGKYSGQKEIEAIVVDNELGYVYYSDETAGVRKYYADPTKGIEELAFFAQHDVKRDHEGLALYKKKDNTGYLVLSDQQNNSIVLFPREGTAGNPHEHKAIANIPVSAIDGLEITTTPINDQFQEGVLVMMSNGRTFHLYNWADIQKRIP